VGSLATSTPEFTSYDLTLFTRHFSTFLLYLFVVFLLYSPGPFSIFFPHHSLEPYPDHRPFTRTYWPGSSFRHNACCRMCQLWIFTKAVHKWMASYFGWLPVKYCKVSPAKSKGGSKLKFGFTSYFIHSPLWAFTALKWLQLYLCHLVFSFVILSHL
jgi:hypothetical protein